MQARVGDREIDLSQAGHAEIGRDHRCLLRVDDERVSPFHAVVWTSPDGWMLTDRGKAGGTWVEGRPVDNLLIASTTQVRLGAADGPVITLRPSDPAPAQPTHAPATADQPVAVPRQPMRPSRSDAPRPTGMFMTSHASSSALRIGRETDNDVVLDDLLVSRHHAELRPRPDGTAELTDRRSLNGTFVNGAPIQQAVITAGDLVGIGHSQFRLVDGRLEEYVDTGEITFEATGIRVTGRRGRTLVDDVGFSLAEKSLFAIVGPSGSGKSSLLGALSGLRPADAGQVLYSGRKLYRDYPELRQRIGFVPQEDVLHRELELRQALEFAGKLRFPSDVTSEQRDARIDEVLAELGLSHRASSPIHTLSGGERKRTSVALELLTRPSLLFLDEPASGLDPGLARVLMLLLRRLADDGRTIVVVTHELSSLALCDQVLVLAPGGVPAYVGAPTHASDCLGTDDMAEVFSEMVTDEARDWRFDAPPPVHHAGAPAPRGSAPPEAVAAAPPVPPGPGTPAARPAPRTGHRWGSQLRTLTARYAQVLMADRRNAALLLLQAPILGVLLLVALPPGELGAAPPTEIRLVSAAGIVLFVLLVGATWLGANNAVREIARELPMLKRERAAGLSLSAYVASKAIVLAGLTIVQSVVLVALATARQRGPTDAVLFGWAPGELMVIVALSGIAAMALGLLVSALSGSPERATSVLPVVLILQLVLAAGVVLPVIVDKPVLRQLSYVSGTQWGIAGAASTVDLNRLQVFDARLRDLRSVDATDPGPAVDALTRAPEPDARWAHDPQTLLTAVAALLALTAIPLVATGFVLRRYDPGR